MLIMLPWQRSITSRLSRFKRITRAPRSLSTRGAGRRRVWDDCSVYTGRVAAVKRQRADFPPAARTPRCCLERARSLRFVAGERGGDCLPCCRLGVKGGINRRQRIVEQTHCHRSESNRIGYQCGAHDVVLASCCVRALHEGRRRPRAVTVALSGSRVHSPLCSVLLMWRCESGFN